MAVTKSLSLSTTSTCLRTLPGDVKTNSPLALQGSCHQGETMLPLFESVTPSVYLADDFESWYAARDLTWKVKLQDKQGVKPKMRVERNPTNSGELPTPPTSPPKLLSSTSSTSTGSSSSFASTSSSLSRADFIASLITPLSPPSPPTVTLSPVEPPPLFTTEHFDVRKSPKGGYGAFATKDIEVGTVVLSEKPLFHTTWAEIFYQYENLSPEQKDLYLSLHGFFNISENIISAIYLTNRFRTRDGLTGILIKGSRFNHACSGYSVCTYAYDEEKNEMVFTSIKPIQQGEEITISYTDKTGQLRWNYGFDCDCPKHTPKGEGQLTSNTNPDPEVGDNRLC